MATAKIGTKGDDKNREKINNDAGQKHAKKSFIFVHMIPGKWFYMYMSTFYSDFIHFCEIPSIEESSWIIKEK